MGKKIVGYFIVLAMLSGCAHPLGALFTGVQYPINATAQPRGDKMGEACSISILGLIAVGDASIDTARRNGRISKITSVDGTNLTLLGFLFAQQCTVVRGK
ncbi:MAG: TRL-like family protein [Bdellovibrionales bacterium]|nr:TRL-like family protein [Bdellovibrionales bacterium]